MLSGLASLAQALQGGPEVGLPTTAACAASAPAQALRGAAAVPQEEEEVVEGQEAEQG